MTKLATREAILLDTGPLVALFDRSEARHGEMVEWFGRQKRPLLTLESVWVEASYVVPSRLRGAVARVASSGAVAVRAIDERGHLRMAELFDKYSDQDPDWTDMALVWLAEVTGVARIATFDIADFSVYRINGRKRFELELLR